MALAKTPVFTTNSREYVLMEGENLGTYLQMEVGAMLVGRIVNYSLPSSRQVMRGDEKGRFEYGGSTVIALLREGSVLFPEELLAAGEQGRETPAGRAVLRITRTFTGVSAPFTESARRMRRRRKNCGIRKTGGKCFRIPAERGKSLDFAG